MKKLKVFVRVPPVADCGVAYYRQWLPMKIAEENGEVEMKCEKFTFAEAEGEEHKELTDEQMQEYGSWADIMYWSRNDAPAYIAQAGGMSAFYRIPSVLDLDDNVQATRPYNPGFRSFHPNSPHMGYNIKSVGVFDTIIVSTKDLYDYYKFYTNPDKIFVCPNSLDWVERDEVYARDFSSELFAKQPGEIRIGWSGSSAHSCGRYRR